MAKQSYKNHVRWYPPHHFVFYPLILALLLFTSYKAYDEVAMREVYSLIAVLIIVIIWLAFMVRQHYALTLLNRLVLTELRYRYFTLTGKRLELFEEKLTEGQLFALRFASDNELESLVNKAVAENLSVDAIKKSIKNWRPDLRRV